MLTYKVNEIKNIVANGIGTKLVQDGFKFYKSAFCYKKETSDNIYEISIPIYKMRFGIVVKTMLYVSNKAIEDFNSNLDEQNKRITLALEIHRFFNSPDGRTYKAGPSLDIIISDDSIVNFLFEKFNKYYQEIIKPYFESFTSLTDFDVAFNNPPFDYSPANVGTGGGERCTKGLIVAHLVDNPKFNELVDIYDLKILETYHSLSIQNYNKVKNYIMEIRANISNKKQ